jgi:hypothetical protein
MIKQSRKSRKSRKSRTDGNDLKENLEAKPVSCIPLGSFPGRPQFFPNSLSDSDRSFGKWTKNGHPENGMPPRSANI